MTLSPRPKHGSGLYSNSACCQMDFCNWRVHVTTAIFPQAGYRTTFQPSQPKTHKGPPAASIRAGYMGPTSVRPAFESELAGVRRRRPPRIECSATAQKFAG